MKATQLLKKDHQKVKGLIKKLKSARKNKVELIQSIVGELKIHTQCEEQIFYPAMKEIDSEMIAEATEEHHLVDTILAEFEQMTGDEGEEFETKLSVLEETLLHHIKEEEGEMFPEAEKKLKEELKTLGTEMEALKGELSVRKKAA